MTRLSLTQLLQPDWVAPGTLAELPLEHLIEQRIQALVLDVDRTLLPRRSHQLPPAMELWLRRAQEHMPLHLFSNNPSRSRIGGLADQLGVAFTSSAGKPRRGACGHRARRQAVAGCARCRGCAFEGSPAHH